MVSPMAPSFQKLYLMPVTTKFLIRNLDDPAACSTAHSAILQKNCIDLCSMAGSRIMVSALSCRFSAANMRSFTRCFVVTTCMESELAYYADSHIHTQVHTHIRKATTHVQPYTHRQTDRHTHTYLLCLVAIVHVQTHRQTDKHTHTHTCSVWLLSFSSLNARWKCRSSWKMACCLR